MASCNSCSLEVVWVISPAGARMPLDGRAVATAEEASRYPVIYSIKHDADTEGEAPPVIAWKRSEYSFAALLAAGGKFFPSHFATCPNAAFHSRGKRR